MLHVSYLIPLSLSPEPGQGLSLQVKLRSSSLEFFSCWFHLASELEVASAHTGHTLATASALPLRAAHSLCSMWAEPLSRAPETTCLGCLAVQTGPVCAHPSILTGPYVQPVRSDEPKVIRPPLCSPCNSKFRGGDVYKSFQRDSGQKHISLLESRESN